jgi:enamine deaminase RidA (YjgF/YER057c/UK114 family)
MTFESAAPGNTTQDHEASAGGQGNASGEAMARLTALGFTLPRVPPARGAFEPFRRSGALVFLAGQICEWEGEVRLYGAIGSAPALDLDAGQRAAQVCALNLLAALSLALDGDLDRVVQCQRLGGFVYCTPGYPDVPKVINGASDLMFNVFGERGKHARTAVGVASLPAGASVEVDAIFEVR